MSAYGLLGENITYSLSPLLHKFLGGYDYRLYDLSPASLDAFFSSRDFKGINVTIPYKKSVIKYCDSISPDASRIQSVNTVINDGGVLRGENTDLYGFRFALSRLPLSLSGGKAVILGSGGAARTVKAVLDDSGVSCVLISRNGDDNYLNLERHSDARILINATPVGSPALDEPPVDLSRFPALEAVFDLIYFPLRTKLLYQAESLGLKTQNGLLMLAAQAARTAELFTGTRITCAQIEEAAAEVLRTAQNIVLIGMPSSGKSSVGIALAKLLGRAFYDTDSLVEARHGAPPEKIIESEGESAFREVETEAIKSLANIRGAVVATGGGAILSKENTAVLKRNGVVVFLNRPLSELKTDFRPLSKSTPLEVLLNDRLPLYLAAADLNVPLTSSASASLNLPATPDEAAKEIAQRLGYK